MWISGTSQYAIRAVVYLATEGTDAPVRVGPIATALDVPQNYLSKTLYQLARAGVLRSMRGPHGGFQLAVPPERLTLERVTAPFDPVGERHCLLGRAQCGGRYPCAAHGRWAEISDSLQAFFRNTTVADLLGDASTSGRTPPTDVPIRLSRQRKSSRARARSERRHGGAQPAAPARSASGKSGGTPARR